MAARKRKKEAQAQEPAAPADKRPGCVVVGIGASAGGLEALKKFFEATPADCGLTFVVVVHLDPTRESHMTGLLARHTRLKVEEARDGTPAEPGHVYVIPPDKYLAVRDGVLRLTEPGGDERAPRVPIDHFFRSLGEDCGEKAIGVVLSGTGSEGALGLKDIHARGGLTLAQAPETAGHPGMPRSAIATGAVDHVLAPEAMPEQILRFVRHPYVGRGGAGLAQTEASPDDLNSVLALIHARTRRDFRRYKKTTIHRRIERRMGLHHIDDLAGYLALLRDNQAEVAQLFKDLLIGVTCFFREPKAWDGLAQDFLAPLLRDRETEAPLRVWVPGCATGEEPYSVAIVLLEQFAAAGRACPVQVFATDINEDALDSARAGVFPVSIAADVPPERLRRYFVRLDEHAYQVGKSVRETVAFAVQDLISDPPFSKLDLIVCRNLLIYLEPDVQRRVVELFHFALNPGGGLFLGSSEGVGRQDGLFEPVNKKWHLYRRVGPGRRGPLSVLAAPGEEARRGEPAPPRRLLSFADLTRSTLLDEYAPASVLINRHYQVLYLHGPTSRYLQLPTGEPTLHLMGMAHDELGSKLRGALHRAVRDNQPVTVGGVRVRRNGDAHPVRLTVRPVTGGKEAEGLYLVTFEDEGGPADAPAPEPADVDGDALVRQLEHELKATREDLQTTIEELETSNEELKASNEEIMSINEELQSANEELETSKEELQSLNEELSTVNAQLADKVDELEAATNDLSNLLSSTDIATLFLDPGLSIKRFTPAITRLVSLIPSDVGRPLADIAPKFTDQDLLADAGRVLQTLTPVEKEVEAGAGRWYIRRILPYRTQDNRIEGVVLTFLDVTPLRQAMEQTRERARLQAVQADLGLRALAGPEPAVLMAEVVRAVADTLAVEFVEVLRLQEGGRTLRLEAGVGWRPGTDGRAGVGVAPDTQAGFTMQFRAPVFVRDYAQERRFGRAAHLAGHAINGGATAVIHGAETPYGVLGAYSAGRRDFSQNDAHFLQAVANLLAQALDRHRREEELRALTAELEQRVIYRTGLIRLFQDLTVAANEADAIDSALLLALRRVCDFDNWQVAHALRVEEGALVSTGLWHARDEGRYPRFRRASLQARFGPGQGLPGRALQTGTVQWARDAGSEPWLGRDEAARAEGVGVGIAFPVLVGKEPTHVLEFYAAEAREPDPGLLELMTGVGAQLGRVVERQRMQIRLAEVVGLEQRRLGQELHDTVGQELVGLGLVAKSLHGRLAAPSPEAARAAQLVEGLEVAAGQVRELAGGLFPPDMDAPGLASALEALAARQHERSGVDCQFEQEGNVAVRDERATIHLYHIAKEALANAVRHARAGRVVVRLEGKDGQLRLEVRDDGDGIPEAVAAGGELWRPGRGMGLRIMRSRAELIGATLEIRRGEAGGTVVSCKLRQEGGPFGTRVAGNLPAPQG